MQATVLDGPVVTLKISSQNLKSHAAVSHDARVLEAGVVTAIFGFSVVIPYASAIY